MAVDARIPKAGRMTASVMISATRRAEATCTALATLPEAVFAAGVAALGE